MPEVVVSLCATISNVCVRMIKIFEMHSIYFHLGLVAFDYIYYKLFAAIIAIETNLVSPHR